MFKNTIFASLSFLWSYHALLKNVAPPQVDLRIYDIIEAVSADSIEADIQTPRQFWHPEYL